MEAKKIETSLRRYGITATEQEKQTLLQMLNEIAIPLQERVLDRVCMDIVAKSIIQKLIP